MAQYEGHGRTNFVRLRDDKTYFLRKNEGGERGELDWRKYDKNATE